MSRDYRFYIEVRGVRPEVVEDVKDSIASHLGLTQVIGPRKEREESREVYWREVETSKSETSISTSGDGTLGPGETGETLFKGIVRDVYRLNGRPCAIEFGAMPFIDMVWQIRPPEPL